MSELNCDSQGSCAPALDISESGEDIFPMPTLLEKCRQQAKGHRGQHNYCGCCTWWEAAEEIERLQKENRTLRRIEKSQRELMRSVGTALQRSGKE